MNHIQKLAVFIFFLNTFVYIHSFSTEAPDESEQEKVLSRDRTPLVFTLGEGLHNAHLAQDEDLGALDISSHPRTVAAYEFLNSYMKGEIPLDLIVSDSAEVLGAYMNDLRKKNLRYTSFRLGMAQPQNGNLYQIRAKLIGFGRKTLALIIMAEQNGQKWKILTFSADYPL